MTGSRPRSDSSEPWDERGSVADPVAPHSTANNNNSNSMRGNFYEEEEELEDGDLPRLNLSRSTSNGIRPVGPNASDHRESLRKLAGGSEELKKQQAFWKQLDAATSHTNDEDDESAALGGEYDATGTLRRKKRFDKTKLAEVGGNAGALTTETREDSKNRSRKTQKNSRGSKGNDAISQLR